MGERVRQISQTLVVDSATEQVLLGLHKTGPFAGSYTGLIGYVDEEESCEDAARRIAEELVGITLGPLQLGAVFRFTTEGRDPADEHEYLCNESFGTPRETDSMSPVWFDQDQIPYDQMPADDRLWYPAFLKGEYLSGWFDFAAAGNVLLSHQLDAVNQRPD